MATLQAIVDQVQDVVAAITGVRAAPHEPPDSISVYPFAVAFVKSGTWTLGRPSGCMTGLHDIVIELHTGVRKDLARDVATAMGYAKSVPQAIGDAQLVHVSLTALAAIGSMSYEFGPLSWNGMDTIGWRWTLHDVKTIDSLT
jgi:hypothetical protein